MNPVISRRKAASALAGSALLTLCVCWVSYSVNAFARWTLLLAFFGGHVALVCILAKKGRFPVSFPLSREWQDLLTVCCACWVGPLLWSYERIKAERHASDKTQVAAEPPMSPARRLWLLVLLLLLLLLLVWWRLGLAERFL